MTLIVALKCTDGVVIAADSASTDLANRTKQPGTKIYQIGNLPILVGGTGDVGMMQKAMFAYNAAHDSIARKQNVNSLRKELKVPHKQEQMEALQSFIQLPNTEPPLLGLLFAGIVGTTPFVLEINPSNTDTEYGNDMGGFYAVGSGATLAQSLYRPFLFETESRTVEIGKVQAYRVLDDAIELSHAFLAHPIHIYTISTAEKRVVSITEDELSKLGITCDAWREMQRNSLHRALNPTVDGTEDIPLPEVQATADSLVT